MLPALSYDFALTMHLQHSANAQPTTPDTRILAAMAGVSASFLCATVETLAVPRHYELQSENNRLTAHSIARQLHSYGYETKLQGEYANVVARSRHSSDAASVLVGAHYDTVRAPRAPTTMRARSRHCWPAPKRWPNMLRKVRFVSFPSTAKRTAC